MAMKWIKRWYEKNFSTYLRKGQVLALCGSRQVGKTSLLNRQLPSGLDIFKDDGDDQALHDILSPLRLKPIQQSFSGYRLVFIDEAQRIPNIGRALKLMVDHIPDLMIVVSGSSAFDLTNKLGEPLTGGQRVA